MTKDQVRQEAFKRRMALDEASREKWSQEFTRNFLDNVELPASKDAVFSAYMPVNAELDIVPLMRALIDLGYRVTVPVTYDREQRLGFLRWTPETPVAPTIIGILEPDPKYAEELVPDFILVPLVAFDKNCHRLGYGSGNFDRTFDWLSPIKPFFTAGVGFDMQEFDHVPVERHDYILDMIVTEKNVYRRKDKK